MSAKQQNPGDLQNLRRRMNRIFDDSDSAESAAIWAPAVDVLESQQEIVLEAELPGMTKEDIDIQLTDDTLTIRGERKLEPAARGEHFHRVERQYGPWQRTFRVEVPIDTSRVTASYEDGVLTLLLPKLAAVTPRQIDINVR